MSVNAPDTEAPAAAADPPPRGFLIRNVQYPYPDMYKLTDCMLVTELCGCRWDDFEARAFGEDDPEGDTDEDTPVPSRVTKEQLFAGLVACAVAHVNPSWPRRKLITFVQSLDEPDVELYGFDEIVASVDADPPSEAPTTELTIIGPTPETDVEG